MYIHGMNRIITSILVASATTGFAQPPTEIGYTGYTTLDPLNAANSAQAYPFISADGLRLYHTREVSGSNRINMATRASAADPFTDAGAAVLPGFAAENMGCTLSADELTIWFSSNSNIMRATRASIGSAFSTPELLTLTGVGSFPKSPTLTPDQEQLIVHSSSTVGVYARTGPTTYQFVSGISGAPAGMSTSKMSLDGLKLYFGATRNSIQWPHRMSRASLVEPFGNLEYLDIDFATGPFRFTQPHLSPDELLLFGTVNTQDLWQSNDLYSALGQSTASVPFAWKPVNMVHPNPATAAVFITGIDRPTPVVLYDALGREALQAVLQPAAPLDVSSLPNGAYLIRFADGELQPVRLVVEH